MALLNKRLLHKRFFMRVLRVWRRSLLLRSVFVTISFTSLLCFIVSFIFISIVINGFLDSRISSILQESKSSYVRLQNAFNAHFVSVDSYGGYPWDKFLQDARPYVTGAYAYGLYSNSTGSSGEVDISIDSDPALYTAVQRSGISAQLTKMPQADPASLLWSYVPIEDKNSNKRPGILVAQKISASLTNSYEYYLLYSLQEADDLLGFLRGIFVALSFVIVIICATVVGLVVRFAFAPVRKIESISRKFARGDLSERVRLARLDEVGRLSSHMDAVVGALQHKITSLEAAVEQQRRFISDVSHELRTPASTIRLAANVVKNAQDALPPTAARSLTLLSEQIDKFCNLVDTLLEMNKYDAGVAVVIKSDTCIAELVQNELRSCTDAANNARSPLLFVCDNWQNTCTQADPLRIARIVRNLVYNAITYGKGKSIVVRVAANDACVCIGVRDYGCGIREDQLGFVFDRFWRADYSRTQDTGGSGLGLAICYEDALAHGGKLAVWSRFGFGSHFLLTIPKTEGADLSSPIIPLEPLDAESTDFIKEGDVITINQGAIAAAENTDTQPIEVVTS